MTDIQIRYWEHKENVRHNMATEQLQGQSLSETIRSNKANEALNKERNMIQQAYNEGYLSEMSYHNRMTETETKRHNIATEGAQMLSAQASMLSASAAMNSSKAALQNAATNARVADSTIALNSARTGLTAAQTRTAIAEAQMAENKAKSPYESDVGYAVRGGVQIFTDIVGAIGGLAKDVTGVYSKIYR